MLISAVSTFEAVPGMRWVFDRYVWMWFQSSLISSLPIARPLYGFSA